MSGINSFTHVHGAKICKSGQQAVLATAAALPDVPAKSIALKASDANLISVYIGGSDVTIPGGAAPGFSLDPGDVLAMTVDNVSRVYAVASTTGATIEWLVEGI